MKVNEVTPPADCGALLTGAQFSDAFSIAISDRALDARHAATRMFGRDPAWLAAHC